MPKYLINEKTGRKRAQKASIGITGVSSPPTVFDYHSKKEAVIKVGYFENPTEILSVSPLQTSTGGGLSVRECALICVSNVGPQTASIALKVPEWENCQMAATHTVTSSTTYQYVHWLLKPGASMMLPGSMCVAAKSSTRSASTADTEYCFDGAAKDDVDAEKAAQLHPLVQDPGDLRGSSSAPAVYEDISTKYTGWKGDYNYFNQDSADTTTPEGLGGNSGALNHGGHAGGATASFHYNPGGICIRFFDPGVMRFGYRHQLPTTSSGLTANTKYSFKITLDGGVTQEVKFTTDTTDLSWGTGTGGNSVLSKINQELRNLAPFKSQAGEEIPAPQFKLENGDIVMYTTTAKYDGGAGANDTKIEFSGSGLTATYTYLNNEGNWPTMATLASGLIKPKLKELSRKNELMFDDGYGNLVMGGKKVGEIEYNSGFMSFLGAPAYSSMEMVNHFGSALGGTVFTTTKEQTGRENYVASIMATSTSIMREASIKVTAFEL